MDEKAAFNNFPYAYGIVERTFSEHMASAFPNLLVGDYSTLPADLQAGSIQRAHDDAMASTADGNYVDGTPRYFTCQSCHVPPTQGLGCNKNNVPYRNDLPLHDMTGGNYWAGDAMIWMDDQGTLLFDAGLSTTERNALHDGALRAKSNLQAAASLAVTNDTLKVTNLTGHKLISGYPEGRRMWLNVKWYDDADTLLREDGAYGTLNVTVNGTSYQVNSILDLHDPNTKIYEAHGAITQEWAQELIDLGLAASTPVEFDRLDGTVLVTLGDVAAQDPGTYHESFHFALNNYVAKDNRLPPYGFSYDEAKKRNSLPVPETQYGDPGTGGTYDYWDSITLSPPSGATYAYVDLVYQPTSWEYVQFLYLANDGSVTFLANEGQNLFDAWRATGMADPVVMTSATWGTPPA